MMDYLEINFNDDFLITTTPSTTSNEIIFKKDDGKKNDDDDDNKNDNNNNNNNVEDDDDDGDDEDDDNIKIEIRNYKDDFLKIKLEIDNLLKLNALGLKTNKVVSCLLNGLIIFIPYYYYISPKLTNLLWKPECQYESYKHEYLKDFNCILSKISNSSSNNEKTNSAFVGFFSAKYQTTNYKFNNCSNIVFEKKNNNNNNNNLIKPYIYTDFTLCVLKDNKIIDVAIHGFKNSISSLIDKYNLKIIYCNGKINDSLCMFLNYKYQPFYEIMKNKIKFINLSKFEFYMETKFINQFLYCERNDKFCSFCKNLNFILTFYDRNCNNFNFIEQQQQNLFHNKQINRKNKIYHKKNLTNNRCGDGRRRRRYYKQRQQQQQQQQLLLRKKDFILNENLIYLTNFENNSNSKKGSSGLYKIKNKIVLKTKKFI